MATREQIWNTTISRYRETNYKENGTQRADNLTKAERRGEIKLSKRTLAGEIVVSETDKSGKTTVSARDAYRKMGIEHTRNDKKISWQEFLELKERALDHTKALSNVFNIGKEHGNGNETRCRMAMAEDKTVIADLIFTQKDHKPLKEDGMPHTRPICLASTTFDQRISEHLCRVINAHFQATDKEETEAISTVDMISAVEKLNDQIRAGEVDDQRIMICSLDVSALYPSIDTKLASKIVRDEIRESPMKFEGVDWRWALVYLALTMINMQKVDTKIGVYIKKACFQKIISNHKKIRKKILDSRR